MQEKTSVSAAVVETRRRKMVTRNVAVVVEAKTENAAVERTETERAEAGAEVAVAATRMTGAAGAIGMIAAGEMMTAASEMRVGMVEVETVAAVGLPGEELKLMPSPVAAHAGEAVRGMLEETLPQRKRLGETLPQQNHRGLRRHLLRRTRQRRLPRRPIRPLRLPGRRAGRNGAMIHPFQQVGSWACFTARWETAGRRRMRLHCLRQRLHLHPLPRLRLLHRRQQRQQRQRLPPLHLRLQLPLHLQRACSKVCQACSKRRGCRWLPKRHKRRRCVPLRWSR